MACNYGEGPASHSHPAFAAEGMPAFACGASGLSASKAWKAPAPCAEPSLLNVEARTQELPGIIPAEPCRVGRQLRALCRFTGNLLVITEADLLRPRRGKLSDFARKGAQRLQGNSSTRPAWKRRGLCAVNVLASGQQLRYGGDLESASSAARRTRRLHQCPLRISPRCRLITMNGASSTRWWRFFGDKGRHARSTVGVAEFPATLPPKSKPCSRSPDGHSQA